MPPKKRKFESTFPAARIKKIMQLDDDVGRVASSVPVVISRAVEIFLQALLTRADCYASSRNAKTLTVSHLKHCIEQEKQWDFLKELTAKIPNISTEKEEVDEAPPPKRGRKRNDSPSRSKLPVGKRKAKTKTVQADQSQVEEESGSESVTPEPVGPHLPSAFTKSSSSSLATSSISAQQSFPGAANMELLEQYKRQVSGPLSISGLMAGPPAEDSDDDYD